MSSDPPRLSLARLNALSLEGSGWVRRPPVRPEARGPGFDAAFDSLTLWYDAVALGGRAVLVAPPPLNLGAAFSRAHLRADGQPVALRALRRLRRHAVAHVGGAAPARLGVQIGRWQGETALSPDQRGLFAGLNASVQISRNNRLEWIADWARFHIGEHGLEAMLLIDNGSDAYPPEAILETLDPLPLKRVVVLCAPQPYGPPRSKTHPGTAKFLQPAMLNLARLRFLGRARAVLNADLDELVWAGPGAGSIFEAACAARLGFVAFAGAWRFPVGDRPPPYRHADHGLCDPAARPCPVKYCIRPDGPLRWASWDVHRLERLALLSARPTGRFGYWHCRGVTTNWKAYDRMQAAPAARPDPATGAHLARHLPPPP